MFLYKVEIVNLWMDNAWQTTHVARSTKNIPMKYKRLTRHFLCVWTFAMKMYIVMYYSFFVEIILTGKTMKKSGCFLWSLKDSPTFIPSVRLVRQTMLQTSSCQIIVQKSAIVFGLGPIKKKYINRKSQNNTKWKFWKMINYV